MPVLDTAVKEVVGINAPKILTTRSAEERKDTFYSEIGNTVGFFGSGLALNTLLNKTLPTKAMQHRNPLAYQYGVLGRSAALFSAAFSIMWAMPFIRNYLTAKQTGSVEFTQVIGARKADVKNPNLHHALSDYQMKAATILGLGLTGVLLSVGGAKLGIQRQWGKAGLEKLFQNPKGWIHKLTLKNGDFAHFAGLPALLFWGVPAYGGWIHASRDSYERKEQLLKFAGFVAGFFGPAVALNRYFQNKFKAVVGNADVAMAYKDITTKLTGPVQKKALNVLAVRVGTSLLSSILLLGTLPQLINIYLTRKRLAQNVKAMSSENSPMMPAPVQAYPVSPHQGISGFGEPSVLAPTPFTAMSSTVASLPVLTTQSALPTA